MTLTKPDLPPVQVIVAESGEWFASCTETVWLGPESGFSDGCNWYGEYRATKSQAKGDAARHRRAHA